MAPDAIERPDGGNVAEVTAAEVEFGTGTDLRLMPNYDKMRILFGERYLWQAVVGFRSVRGLVIRR